MISFDTDFPDVTAQWRKNVQRLGDKPCVHELSSNSIHTWNDMGNLVQQLRVQLRAHGLGRGCRLALLTDASAHWIAMVWACWEEGVCWSPFPSSVPLERCKQQLEFGAFHAQWDGQRFSVLNPTAELSTGAYLIFTSGTTGTPKGVMGSWWGLTDLWRNQTEIFSLNENSTSVWMLSPSFDASISDVGVALWAGACLVVVPQKHWLRHKRWKEDMERLNVTHLDAPPSLLARWENKPLPRCLQVVIAGGEPTPPSLLKAWSHHVRWVNVYGPTETTVCSSAEVRAVARLEEGAPTLGTPFSHVFYKVVHPTDDDSAEGELWIGGNCVAQGYWRNPSLTAEKFVYADNCWWFKSGDWVRRTADNWEYCGRLDRQIKRNGQLINLDEIEHTLSQCPGYGQVVVVLKNSVLWGVYCASISSDCLQSYAQTRLPAWGVPRFVRQDQWPLTPHNKIDRAAVENML